MRFHVADQTGGEPGEIRDRITRELCPVCWSPAYRIRVTHHDQGLHYSLEPVYLHAVRATLVHGPLLVDQGTLTECLQALPPNVSKMPELKPTRATKGILEEWF